MTNQKASLQQIGGEHYKSMAIQPAQFITANGLSFLEGSIIKRVCRHRTKGSAQDIRKAIHELELILEWEYPEETPAAATEADPYAELKAAHAAGKVIEFRLKGDAYLQYSEKLWASTELPAWHSRYEYRIKPTEPAPWSLASHLKQHFGRELAADERPHRDDFTEAMLEGGWRPVLTGENYRDGDEYQPPSESMWFNRNETSAYHADEHHYRTRTRRPLPAVSA